MGMKLELTLTDDQGRTYQGIAQLKAVSGARNSVKKSNRSAAGPVKGLPGHILALREKNFFREPRTPAEVHATLLETYHCVLNRVQMALLRLHRKRELRKAVKKIGNQDHAGYVW
jgi:hypothetical protein